MSGTSSAVDLRDAFARHLGQTFWMPAESEQTDDHDADDHDQEQEQGDGDGNQEEEEGEAGAGSGEEDGEAEHRRKLSQEAKKWRRKFREAEARVKELEGTAGVKEEVRSLRLRLAFERAARTVHLEDLDAAWKLAEDDLSLVDVHDDGTVDTDRLGDVVAHVAHRYPYLVEEASEGTSESHDPPPSSPSGRPMNGRKKTKSQLDAEALAQRFPALRGPQGYW